MRLWPLLLCLALKPALAEETPVAPAPPDANEVVAKANVELGQLQQALGAAQLQIIDLKKKAALCPPKSGEPK